MTIFAYVMVALIISAWWWADRQDRKDRRQLWREIRQGHSWQIVPPPPYDQDRDEPPAA